MLLFLLNASNSLRHSGQGLAAEEGLLAGPDRGLATDAGLGELAAATGVLAAEGEAGVRGPGVGLAARAGPLGAFLGEATLAGGPETGPGAGPEGGGAEAADEG